MKKTTLVFLAMTSCLIFPAMAQTILPNPGPHQWTMIYKADQYPSHPWVTTNDPQTQYSLRNGILDTYSASSLSDLLYFERQMAMTNSANVMNVVEFTMNLEYYEGSTREGGCAVSVNDGTYRADLLISYDRIQLGPVDNGLEFAMNPVEGFHVYRIYMQGEDVFVTVDGNLVIDGSGMLSSLSWVTGPQISSVTFGDISNEAGSVSHWHSLFFGTTEVE